MGYDVIIAGAGASGLMAAIAAARMGSSVLVIEQKEKAGKKILATGNGKCNFTNLVQSPECYRSDDNAFAMSVLDGFDTQRTIAFFEELGICPKEKNGYLYPNSEQAASVVQVLMMECRRLGVDFAYNEKVIHITEPYFTVITEHRIPPAAENKKAIGNGKKGSKGKRTVSDTVMNIEEKRHFAKKLILTTGGCASSKLGSDGSGYLLAKLFDHTIIKPLPALVQLKSPENYCRTLSGVRMAGKVGAYTNKGMLLSEETGELIFTDYGISGIPIMQISRYAAKALDQGNKVFLKIDLLPQKTIGEVILLLDRRIGNSIGKTTEEMMVGLFHHKVSYILIKETGLDPMKEAAKLKDREIEAIAMQIKEFHMRISDTNSFENAQVTAGGVATAEINEKTLESKRRKNLYFAGELLDVDGTCGGYNLQWAWSSGYLAGTAAGRKRHSFEESTGAK
ncbi:MAG TPA: aminoacetone oxidase family FAD-binding enzyme [Lachnospiraceae bacterium]|nr:aminoacetone oxidase family FAD-binding enzyme [Lachnospiraceae bacterium]